MCKDSGAPEHRRGACASWKSRTRRKTAVHHQLQEEPKEAASYTALVHYRRVGQKLICPHTEDQASIRGPTREAPDS